MNPRHDLKPLQPVQVTWIDIIKDPGWDSHEDVECPEFKSIGYFVYQDHRCIKIADTIDADGTGYAVMALPLGCVLSITPL